jgi:NADH dehydrogenase
MEVDARGTQVAAQVAKRLHVRRFVYLSGAGAGQGLSQPWMRAKDIAEAAVREAGLEHAFLRPSWIYGPGDRTMSRFVAFCRHLPAVPVIGDGRTPVFPSHVADVARAVADLALRDDAPGQALEFGAERLTMDEVVRTVQKVVHRRRPLVHHPVALMKLLTLPLQLMRDPMLSPAAVDFVTQVVEIDTGPALAYFGFRPRTLEEGLRGDLGR